jgi:DnaJ-class molecular chaperone
VSFTALLAFLVVLAAYGVVCRVWPLTNCGACKGSGKRPSPFGRSFRHCPRCEGSGRRERWGAGLFRGRQ